MTTWTDRTVTVGDVRAHYLEAGEGEPLLLIHGGGMSSSAELNYGVVMEPLGRRLRTIAVDVVGFGETEGGDERHYAASAQGDFLIDFMRALDLRAHVAGNSHGGWLAQYVAHEAPDRVRKLVIINSLNGTTGIPPAPEGLRYILGPQGHANEAPTLDNVRRGLERLFFDRRLVTDARVGRTLEIAERNYAFARARAEARQATIEGANADLDYRGQHISAFAEALPMEVLLTWSRENNGATPTDAVRFLEKLRHAELHVFVDAGHHVMTEHPERWSDVVAGFLLAP